MILISCILEIPICDGVFAKCDFRKCRFVSFLRQADTADMSLVAPGYHRRHVGKTRLQSAVEKYKFLEKYSQAAKV